MKRSILLTSATLAVALVVGCEKETASTDRNAESARPAGEQVSPQTPRDTTGVGGTMQGMQDTAGKAASDATSGAQGAVSGQLDQVSTYIQQGKYEMAEQALSRVEQQKDRLPQTLQTKVTDLRQQLDTAKSGQSSGTTGGGATTRPTGGTGAQ